MAIVLDDVHVISDETCWRSLERLVEHLPEQARLIVTTRSDPPLPLGRLRARGGLGEIRARDLAFSVDEARQLLVQREKIALDDADVELLVERTEGWPAGLYLAALWLRGLDDPHAGVQAFHGSQRHVADYLTGEVLDRLEEDTRRFLLRVVGPRHLHRPAVRRRTRPLGFRCPASPARARERLPRLARRPRRVVSVPPPLRRAAPARALDRGADRLCSAAHGGERVVSRARLARGSARARGGRGRPQAGSRDPRRRAPHVRPHGPRRRPFFAGLPRSRRSLLVERPEIPVAAVLAAGLVGSPAHIRHRFVAVAERARSERPDNWTPYLEAALGVGRLAWVEGDIGEEIERGRRAVVAMRGVPEIAVPALATLGFLLFLNGDHAESQIRAQEALDRPEAAERPHGLVMALATLSMIESDSGLQAAAEERAREAIAAATSAGVDRSASGGAARVALASALAARGELARGRARGGRGREAQAMPRSGGRSSPRAPRAGTHPGAPRAARARDRRARPGQEGARRRSPMRARCPSSCRRSRRLSRRRGQRPPWSLEEPTEAELNVLRLLSTDLSQREIGARLYLSVNTVKTHTRTLYRKLGVTSREGAVERATALGLLDDGSPG